MCAPVFTGRGLYGMNFEKVPELTWEYSYYVFWAVMLTVAALIVWWFKRMDGWSYSCPSLHGVFGRCAEKGDGELDFDDDLEATAALSGAGS